MSYCRFENTARDLRDCVYAIENGEHTEDLKWVNFQLTLIRDGKTLNTMNMRRANELWRAYV